MTHSYTSHAKITTVAEYQEALRRVSELKDSGETAETNEEVAALEGAIARYVAQPGQPDERKARPSENGEDTM